MIAGLVAAIALYGAGLSASLSPCVVPLVPGYVGVLVGSGAARRQRLQLVAVFAAGVIAVFVIVGGATTWLGLSLSRWVGSVQRVTGALLIALAVVWLAGRLGALGGAARLVRRLPAQPHGRALLLGIGCATAWSPCAGPLLGAALTAAGGSGSPWRASALLGAYGCGVLTPFCALALIPGRILGERVRAVGRASQVVGAGLMLGIGVLLVAGWYDAWTQRLLIGT